MRRAHFRTLALACAINRDSSAATAARAHRSSSSRFVMTQLSNFFAPQGYTTRFKNHDVA